MWPIWWNNVLSLFMKLFHPNHLTAAYIPSHSTNQWRSVHRESRDTRHLEPPDSMVPVQPPRLQDSRQPFAPWGGGWTSPWVPPSRPVREGRPTQEHSLRGWRWFIGCRRTSRDPEHVPHHLRDRFF